LTAERPDPERRATRRIAVGIEYVGTGYCGWQRQDHARSVQQQIELALSAVADEPVSVTVAGRTDAGVHALGQVAHFDTAALREPRAWLLGANSQLPADVNLTWVREVDRSFNARRSATARTYHYLIFNHPVRSALVHQRCWWLPGVLDLDAMTRALPGVLGEHDFSAFRAAECQAKNATRDLQRFALGRHGDRLIIECRANAFLHHMVRNLVGSLVRIGRGEQPPEWLRSLLEGRDRRAAGMTAPACGLYLSRVHYPVPLGIPAPRPAWWHDLG
jgi:tRNA pseudouridine38-40 synthase